MQKLGPIAMTTAILLLIPIASAHAAPPPREFETRALHDYNDDHTGNGFDTIALDVREAYLPNAPAFVLRSLLNGGTCVEGEACPEQIVLVEFMVGDEAKEVSFVTTDGGQSFSGNAAKYFGPMGINDGARFAVEAWVPFTDLGIKAGSEISNFFVTSTRDGVTDDTMPTGLVPEQPDPTETAYDIGTYTVQTPDYYASLTSSVTELTLVPGGNQTVSLSLENKLSEQQTFEFTVNGDSGISGIIRDDSGAAITNYSAAPNFTATINLEVKVGETADGFLTVVASSEYGARESFRLPVKTESTEQNDANVMSPDILPGESWSYVFQTAGLFSYHNHHGGQLGSIDITSPHGHDMEEGEEMNTTEDMDSLAMNSEPMIHTITFDGEAFEPEKLTISKGDAVVFTNSGDSKIAIMGGVTAEAAGHEHDEESTGLPVIGMPISVGGLAALAFAVRLNREQRL